MYDLSNENFILFSNQVHGSLGEKSPPQHTYDSENEDDSSESSIITGGAQTPPSANRLGHTDAHSLKSHTPLSIKSEHSSTAAHTRSPSSGAMAPSNNNNNSSNNNNLIGSTSLAGMPPVSPYGVNSNLAPPPLTPSHHFNHPNALLYHQHHHHHPSNDWYHSAAVAAVAPPTDINHLNHFNHHPHLMHHATAY